TSLVTDRLASLGASVDRVPLDNGDTRLLVTPTQGSSLRPVIDVVNSSLDIKAIEPAIPSMEEIFIKTVQQNTPSIQQ
ncbi:MAG: DUF4162 domain-containing protein, partial [Muribaculaceae bacterium]|nr:DUF4162 domain-containing protein [Muribaculaceae bacterium]